MSDYAIIYQSELDFVSRCILDYPNIETGGQMFGYWTDDGTPVVLYTIGPGPRANHQVAFFNQDLNYLETIGEVLTQQYGLQHIGEWHSHHKLCLAHPSGHDAESMANGLVSSNRSRFLLCIGNCTATSTMLNPFNFELGRGADYSEASWIVKPMASPFRALIDGEQQRILCQPAASQANYTPSEMYSRRSSEEHSAQSPLYEADYWLSVKSNNRVLKSMMDYLSADSDVINLKPMLDNKKQVRLTFLFRSEYMVTIIFEDSFPSIPPTFKVSHADWRGVERPCRLQLPVWHCDGDIYEAFVEYYKHITIL